MEAGGQGKDVCVVAVGSNSTLEITSIRTGRGLKRNEPGLEDQNTGLKSYSVLE